MSHNPMGLHGLLQGLRLACRREISFSRNTDSLLVYDWEDESKHVWLPKIKTGLKGSECNEMADVVEHRGKPSASIKARNFFIS
jgi:hypothetical protein